ncbi:OmpA family protein [Sorangium sp. So ce513]|uniref:OmpA family protein n=1 Tax=Sorangium sp. So ce513 TaxID=3133315 RepID=UPI003F5E021A
MRGLITVGAALAGALAGIALGASPARAEGPGAVALSRIEPTPAGDPLFAVPSPFIGGHLVPRGLVVLDHAEDPLTLSDGAAPERAIVGSQSLLHVGGSLSLWDRLLVSASLPLALAQSGDGAAAAAGAGAPEAPSSPALGDLRLGVRVRLLGDERDALQIGTGAAVHLPTGASDAYVGEGAVRVTPQLLLGGRASRVVWSVAGGAVMRSSGNPSTLAYGGGAGVLLWDERLQVGPELYAETPLHGGSLALTSSKRVAVDRTTSAELLLSARLRPVAGLVLGAAAGPGIGEAVGTPSFRAMATVAWAPPAQPREDAEDPDPDADGIAGAADACPYAHGPASADARRNGCPVEDRDEDGVADADDQCPDEPAGSAEDPARRGCPADQDGDGLPDALDACPTEKGDAAGGATRPGCPTDSAGNARYNETISTARAEAVRRWLIDNGIAAERLVAKGYGSSRPVADNKSAAGREKNRRIEILVLEKK